MRPYPQAYLIKSAFMPEVPEVHIGVVDAAGMESISWNDVIVGRMVLNECWNHIPGSRQSLFTFTNAHSVELLVNGQSMGVQQNDTTQANLRNMIYWKDVPYGNGGSVVAIARDKSGKEVLVIVSKLPERLWHSGLRRKRRRTGRQTVWT